MKSTKYTMTEVQIESLAAERTASAVVAEAFDGTYLRVLIAATHTKLGPKRGKAPATDVQLSALESVAVPFYAAVLRGVTTDDIAVDPTQPPDEALRRSRERSRRATFARSAKSTIVSWLKEGGDLRLVNVETVTKGELRGMTAAARADRTTGVAPVIEKARDTILAAAARVPAQDARAQLESVIEALQAALEKLDDAPPEPVVRRPTAFREAPRLMNQAA